MAIFMGVHKVPDGMTEEEAQAGYTKYKESAMKSGLKPLGAVVSIEKGFAYCQTEAGSANEVREAHSVAQIPLEDVVEIKILQ